MKSHNFFRKTTVYALTMGISVFLFVGCQNNSASQSTNNTPQSTNTQNSNRPSEEQIKKTIQDNIQPLITAGTITQDQADKIVTAYTSRSTGNRQNKSQNNKQNNKQGNTQDDGQNKPKNNFLSKLVSDGVITQPQADAVTQKMKENSTYKNNGQDSQNNNAASSN